MIERERKYIFTNYFLFLNLKRKAIKKIKIIQFYNDKNERYRLNLNEDIWIYNQKKYISYEKRFEKENIINNDKINDLKLSNSKCVAKYRYILNEDPEIVLDEIKNIDNILNYKKNLKYILEIEEKNIYIKDLDDYLKNYLMDDYNYLKDVTNLKEFSNINFASNFDIDYINLIKKFKEE